MIGIYKITNNINNKVYIGQTVKTFETRYANDIKCAFYVIDVCISSNILFGYGSTENF